MPNTVLIIDDDASLQTVLEIALQQAGYQVLLADNGEEGLAMLAQRPDVVITDVMMPQMDGVAFFREIQEHLRYENIPIIVMTALTRRAWFSELEDEGAVILQKPFNIDQLVALVGSHMES